jgi:hypothetical protein
LDRATTLEADAEAALCDPGLFGLEEDDCEHYAAMLRDEAEEVRRTVPGEIRLPAALRAGVLQPIVRRLALISPRRWALHRQSRTKRAHVGSRRTRRGRRPARSPGRSDDPHEPLASCRGADDPLGARP